MHIRFYVVCAHFPSFASRIQCPMQNSKIVFMCSIKKKTLRRGSFARYCSDKNVLDLGETTIYICATCEEIELYRLKDIFPVDFIFANKTVRLKYE